MDYTKVIVIDFADHNNPTRRAQLSKEISNALHNNGYCVIINHGLDAERVQRMFDVADIPFSVAIDEEKQKFAMREETGSYKGYKIRGQWEVVKGQKENCEMYHGTHPVIAP